MLEAAIYKKPVIIPLFDEVTEKYVENAIAAMESGKKPDPATTRAIGCSIKYKK